MFSLLERLLYISILAKNAQCLLCYVDSILCPTIGPMGCILLIIYQGDDLCDQMSKNMYICVKASLVTLAYCTRSVQ